MQCLAPPRNASTNLPSLMSATLAVQGQHCQGKENDGCSVSHGPKQSPARKDLIAAWSLSSIKGYTCLHALKSCPLGHLCHNHSRNCARVI